MANFNRGISHIGLATHDADGTRQFYEGVLGFDVSLDYGTNVTNDDGSVVGHVRHLFFDTGHQEWLVFMAPSHGIPGVTEGFDTGVNEGLGVPRAFYHFAFEVSSQEHLEERRHNLLDNGIPVTAIHDFGLARSCYFEDPVNGLQLEYAHAHTRIDRSDARAVDLPLRVLIEFPWMKGGPPPAASDGGSARAVDGLGALAATLRTSVTEGS
jgi:catechol 2,3-dioxygenase-like lactoylglutathione lyase family enzyme